LGVGTIGPDFGLEISASSSYGYFGIGNTDAFGDKFIIDENGNVAINDISPGALFEIQDDDSNDYLFAVSSTSVGDYFNVASTGYIGIGTTTPSALLEINADTSNNTTAMQTYDSGGHQVFILDEGSSPFIWEQALSQQFEQGSFYQVATDENDFLLLAKDFNGNYYSNGSFTSSIFNYSEAGGVGDFIKFTTNTNLFTFGKITAHIEISDDNFSTIKDSTIIELTGGTQEFDISFLPNAQYVRVKLDFKTENISITPHFIFFEVWADINANESIATNTSSVVDTSEATTNSVFDAIYINNS